MLRYTIEKICKNVWNIIIGKLQRKTEQKKNCSKSELHFMMSYNAAAFEYFFSFFQFWNAALSAFKPYAFNLREMRCTDWILFYACAFSFILAVANWQFMIAKFRYTMKQFNRFSSFLKWRKWYIFPIKIRAQWKQVFEDKIKFWSHSSFIWKGKRKRTPTPKGIHMHKTIFI